MALLKKKFACVIPAVLLIASGTSGFSQAEQRIIWNKSGKSYYHIKNEALIEVSLPGLKENTLVPRDRLIPSGKTEPLKIDGYAFSPDNQSVLIFTNTRRVWRYNTRGDFWIYRVGDGSLTQLGKSLPGSSLMFAKISPDGKNAAYVSGHNIYVEDLLGHEIRQLTLDGTRKLINGTFDWVYEEEFFCRDGFRWSPDSKRIAFWQIDAKETRDYLMINNTDSTYPFVKPVEYPVAGEAPSPYRIGVVNVENAQITWMDIPTDPVWRSYVPRMEWANNNDELIIQHLNRKQNSSDLMLCNVSSGSSRTIFQEHDSAWIDILALWDEEYQGKIRCDANNAD